MPIGVANSGRANGINRNIFISPVDTQGLVYLQDKDLHHVLNSSSIMDSIVQFLTQQNYAATISSFHSSILSQLDSTEYINQQLALDQKYGKVTGFSMQGFKLERVKVKSSMLKSIRISGVLFREIQNTDFSLTIEQEGGSDSILGLRYTK